MSCEDVYVENEPHQPGLGLRSKFMPLCAQCGMQLANADEICTYHTTAQDTNWAVSNRNMCNFIHRKEVLPETENEKEKRKEFIDSLTPPDPSTA